MGNASQYKLKDLLNIPPFHEIIANIADVVIVLNVNMSFLIMF